MAKRRVKLEASNKTYPPGCRCGRGGGAAADRVDVDMFSSLYSQDLVVVS